MTLAFELATLHPVKDSPLLHGIVTIVDDDTQISRALGLWLDLQGLRAVHHTSGESLLQSIYVEEGELTFHLGDTAPIVMPLLGAVIDLNLPGINGIELAKALQQMSPTLPIVLITALREEERVRYGALPPGIRCLKKPFDLDVLEDALFPLLS